ncbi:MAG: response regulator, partial [Symbiobacteriaceae bacterium]|nr:response regulator [Symbiobacteriaceae bacterium]
EFVFEKMLQRMVNVMNFRAAERQQSLIVHIANEVPRRFIGDDQRLAQVVTNLLGNAIKFTPNGGAISLSANLVSTSDDTSVVSIAVTDNGIGISPEQQERLFRSFVQAEASTTRKYGGTGLGLAISKSIIELMGGSIAVESQLGVGSTFTVTVPLRHGVTREVDYPQQIEWGSIRVLTVDDDSSVLEYIQEVLRRAGAVCDVARSGEEALELVERKGEYQFYFLDWQMPGIDGISLARMLKTRRSYTTNVVIMISSNDWTIIEPEAKAAGVDSFLSKPLFPSDIVDIITETIGVVRNDNPTVATTELSLVGKRILLAEDVELNREIVIALLEATGVEIVCAENGEEALRLYAADPDYFDLILMDLQMPEMDGYEATRRIRCLENPLALKVPIIALTANVFREDVEKCLEAGMNGHLGKPLDFGVVLATLQEYLFG